MTQAKNNLRAKPQQPVFIIQHQGFLLPGHNHLDEFHQAALFIIQATPQVAYQRMRRIMLIAIGLKSLLLQF